MSDENINPNNIVVSFEDVKMKDFRTYWTAVARGDWKRQDEFFAKVVKSWDYDLDPSASESYEQLSILEYNKVKLAIRQKSKLAKLELVGERS